MRVVTWNIHAGVGTDGRFDAGRIVTVLDALAADVVALQEVLDTDCDGRSLVGLLEQRLGLHGHFAPTLAVGGRDFGNLTLCRIRPSASRHHALPHTRGEPRNAIETLIRTGDVGWQLFNTHWGLTGGERARQSGALLDRLRQSPAAVQVLAGDLNEWRLEARLGSLARYFAPRTRRLRTFPSRWPLFALDRVLVRAPARVARLWTVTRGDARVASDHLPLVADIDAVHGPGPGAA